MDKRKTYKTAKGISSFVVHSVLIGGLIATTGVFSGVVLGFWGLMAPTMFSVIARYHGAGNGNDNEILAAVEKVKDNANPHTALMRMAATSAMLQVPLRPVAYAAMGLAAAGDIAAKGVKGGVTLACMAGIVPNSDKALQKLWWSGKKFGLFHAARYAFTKAAVISPRSEDLTKTEANRYFKAKPKQAATPTPAP